MKKFVLILFLVFVGFSIAFLIGLSIVKPQVGYEVVLIDRPLFFGKGGIQPEPVKTDTKVTWRTTEQIHVHMSPYFSYITLEDILSKDGLLLHTNIYVNLKIKDSVRMISKFGKDGYDWFEEDFKPKVIVPLVHNAISRFNAMEIRDHLKIISDEIKNELTSYVKKNELPIELVYFYIHSIILPRELENQLIETRIQQAKLETEQKRQKVEEQRLETERKRAEADIAYRDAMHLTNKDFAILKQIDVLQNLCRLNNKCTFLIGRNDIFPIKHSDEED